MMSVDDINGFMIQTCETTHMNTGIEGIDSESRIVITVKFER